MSRSTTAIRSSLRSVATALAGVASVAAFGNAVKDAMKFEAAVQQVNRMMGASTEQFRQWVNTQSGGFGLAISEATQYGATYANLISGFSSTQEETMQRTIELLETSAIVASATGRDIADVMERIRSGMLGETDAIEDLGINVNVAMLESTEAFRQFAGDSSWAQLSFQTQQTILYYGILEQAARKYGNELAANTMTRQALFLVQLKNARLYLGQAFLPIYNVILPALTAMAKALATALKWLAAFTTALFGGGKSTGGGQQVGAIQDQTAAVSGLGGAYQGAGDQAAGAGDSIKKAGDQAKKAAKQARAAVAGFDKLNLVGNSAAGAADDAADGAGAGGSAGGIGGGGGMGAISAPDFSGISDVNVDPLVDKIRKMLDDIKASFSDAWSFIAKGWAGMGPALKPFVDMMGPIGKSVDSMGKTFLKLKDNVLVPVAQYMLGNFIPSLVVGFTQSFAPVIANQIVWAFAEFDKTFKFVTEEATRLWNTVWLPNLEVVKNAFLLAMPVIASALDQLLTEAINPFIDFMLNEFMIPLSSSMTETLVPLFTGTLSWAILEFAKTAQNAVNEIVKLWEGTLQPSLTNLRDMFLEVIPKIGDSFSKLLDGTIKPFIDFMLNEFIIPISSAIIDTLVPVFTDVLVAAFKEAAETFDWAVDLINDIYETVLEPVFELIKDIVLDTLQIIKDAWDKHGKQLLDSLSEVIDNIRDTVQRLWDDVLKPIIQPFLQALKDVWNNTIKGILEKIVELVLKLVQAAADIYNKFISPLINYIIDKLAPSVTEGFKIILDIVTEVISGVGDIISGLLDTLGGLIDFIAGVFTGDWDRAWSGIKTIFKGVFDSLWGIVKLPLNLIIGGINKVIDGLNSVSISMPAWLGGGTFGLSIPHIPKLAKGGLAYGPTLAMVGDNPGARVDPEVVAPLSKLEGMINSGGNNRDVINVLNSILRALQSGQGDLVLQVGSTELGRVAARGINDIQRRTGVSPLQI